MQLPKSGSTSSGASTGSAVRPVSGVRQTSFVTQRGASSTPAPRSASRGRHAYDADYTRLTGQLEYSQFSDRWKLRYIPIDGDTDDFGGSVILADNPLLDSFQPGDFVSVDGALADQTREGGNFSPTYRVDRIERAQ
jgi:hypothetical protein